MQRRVVRLNLLRESSPSDEGPRGKWGLTHLQRALNPWINHWKLHDDYSERTFKKFPVVSSVSKIERMMCRNVPTFVRPHWWTGWVDL